MNNSIYEHGFAYQARPGYVGEDHFQVTADRIVHWSDTPVKATFDVTVDVVEHF